MNRPTLRTPVNWLALALAGAALTASAQVTPRLAPEPIDSTVAAKLLVNTVKPEYPAVAQVNYIQGKVDLMLVVGPDGHVRRVHVIKGNALLAASAIKAISAWVYRPYVTASGPEPFSTLVKVRFAMRDRDVEHSPSTPERDLAEAVKPPEVMQKTSAAHADSSIRLRVLVGEGGRAIDSTLLAGPAALLNSAQRKVAQWAFRPARWGNLTVPWYMDVDVPVDGTRGSRTWEASSERGR